MCFFLIGWALGALLSTNSNRRVYPENNYKYKRRRKKKIKRI